jgi:hypothetical protein
MTFYGYVVMATYAVEIVIAGVVASVIVGKLTGAIK